MKKEIKEALEKATPGPWVNGPGCIYKPSENPLNRLTIGVATYEPNAHLIANAPAWLLHQQELIEQLQNELKRRVIQADINISLGSTVISMQEEIEKKDAEIQGLREEVVELSMEFMFEPEKDKEIKHLTRALQDVLEDIGHGAQDSLRIILEALNPQSN